MRLRHVLPFFAALALAGCNGQPANKTDGSARTVLPQTAAAPACPKAPEPVCPPAKGAKPGKVAKGAAGHAVRHAMWRRPAYMPARRVAETTPRRHMWRRYGGLAGGPPGPAEREYARPPADYRWRGDERGYRYGPYPPPPGYDERYDDERNYGDRRYDERRHRDYDERYGDDRGYFHRPAPPPAPPPPRPPESGYYYRHGEEGRGPDRSPDRYSSGRGSGTYESHSSSESGGSHVQGGYDHGGSTYDYDRDRDDVRSSSGYRERRSYGGTRSYRSEERSSETSTSSSSERRTWGDGGCCQSSVGAAGFDRNGYLTWPGKVPAQP